MSRAFCILSGKGGVGKTTAALNLGVALVSFGTSALVVDASVHTPNVAICLGSPRLQASLHSILAGKSKEHEAIYTHPSGLRVIPGDIAAPPQPSPLAALGELIKKLKRVAEVVILDASPGVGRDVEHVIEAADEGVLVVTPDLPSVSDALRVKRLAQRHDLPLAGIILNRVLGHEADLPARNVQSLLGLPMLSEVPEDVAVRMSVRLRHPVLHSHPESDAALGFRRAAAELLSRMYESSIHEAPP